jgi:predicted O-linked N-acetylglucosamine transferase (SPINDLY family)
MPDHAVHQTFQAAIAQYQAGSPLAAEKLCRRVLSFEPNSVDALNLLGGCLYQTGNLNEAIEIYQRIAALKPDLPEAHNNLGGCLQRNGRIVDAIAAYKTAIGLKPDFSEAKSNLAVAYFEWGKTLLAGQQTAEALEAFQQAVSIKPDFIEALHKIGACQQSLENFDGAVAAFQAILQLKPDMPGAFNNLGIALRGKGQLDEAVAAFRQAIRLKSDLAEAHDNLGNALKEIGQLDEAIASYQRAIRLKPDLAEAHYNLGNALGAKGQVDEAIVSHRQAISLKPDYAEAYNNLGNALKDKGQLEDAIAAYRQAIWLKPDRAGPHSNLIYTLHYRPGYDGGMIHEELRRWNREHSEPLKKLIQPHTNDRDADRRLRIGYVSPDFREHPVGQYLLPLLRHHDHGQMEIFCYSNVRRPDTRTDQLRHYADAWRSIVGLSYFQAAALIRQDGIDILVDLALHTAGNRLVIFAHKPAPVQVSYLAYAGSSGLTAMDYRLSDPYLDPADGDESVYSEQTLRLPQTYWCYRPVVDVPLQAPLAPEKGFITFGCLNNFCKVNEPLLSLWTRVLGAVPHSRLLLHAYEGSHRQRVLDHLRREGVDPQRASFVGRAPLAAYLERYHSIDIALDTFPFGGGTTTSDALWMGVPVVSLAGNTAVSRAGSSILSNVGLPELVANTPEEYVRLAVCLANDRPRLKDLHATLRQRMQASPLMDAPRFARNVEAAYRQMWRSWCERGGNSISQCSAQ